MQTPITFILAFVVVLALIALAAWLVRRFAGNRLGSNASRSRMPRLAVIDAAAVDGRRRLVLVRRDNVEHLLMIGGPTDIVVEPNIVRAIPGRDQAPRPGNPGAELSTRLPPLGDSASWSDNDGSRTDFDQPEPALPDPPARPGRPSFADDVRRPAPALPERRSDPIANFSPEPLTRPEPRPDLRNEPVMPRAPRPEPPIMPRAAPPRPSEPPRMPPPRLPERAPAPPPIPVPVASPPPPPAPASATASADQNLAEMAQRLEAALRRPPGEARPADEPRVGAPPVAPETPRPAAAPAASAPPQKSGFENLEDEMASLLGRPKSPS